MSIVKKVAKMRFFYHVNMIDVINVLNQFGLVNNIDAEREIKHHFYETVDCLGRLGYDISRYMKMLDDYKKRNGA